MTIELISEENYRLLKSIQESCPKLTFQNRGYEYIDKSSLDEQSIKSFSVVEGILKSCIKGFKTFNNFQVTKEGEIKVRFQYNWTEGEYNAPSFIGVGYLLLDELLNGFKPQTAPE